MAVGQGYNYNFENPSSSTSVGAYYGEKPGDALKRYNQTIYGTDTPDLSGAVPGNPQGQSTVNLAAKPPVGGQQFSPDLYNDPTGALNQPAGDALKSYLGGSDPAQQASLNGTSGIATPGSNTSAPDNNTWKASGTGTRGTTTAPTNPATSGGLLKLVGNNVTQARQLGDWLNAQGVQFDQMVVGGKSPYDDEINRLITQAGNPSTTPAEAHLIANDIAAYIKLRNKSTTNPELTYGGGNNFGAPSDIPGNRTSSNLISNIGQPPPASTQPVSNGANPPVATSSAPPAPTSNTPARSRLLEAIDALQNEGTMNDQSAQLQKGQLISDIEAGNLTKRQQIADRGAASGIQGGALQSLLNQQDTAAGADRAKGLTDINLGILDKQYQSKVQALSSLLQLQGLDQTAADNQAARLLQGQESAAQLAVQNENNQNVLNYNSQNATTQSQLIQRGQDINAAIALLQLAAQGDTGAADRALTLLVNAGLNPGSA